MDPFNHLHTAIQTHLAQKEMRRHMKKISKTVKTMQNEFIHEKNLIRAESGVRVS